MSLPVLHVTARYIQSLVERRHGTAKWQKSQVRAAVNRSTFDQIKHGLNCGCLQITNSYLEGKKVWGEGCFSANETVTLVTIDEKNMVEKYSAL